MLGRNLERTLQKTKDLVAFESVSHLSNEPISRYVADQLEALGFDVEWHSYIDGKGQTKVSLVAKRGQGTGGVGYLAHTDVVPAEDWSVPFCGPFEPTVQDDKLYGRGACDMKGSLACALTAAESLSKDEQRAPIYFVVTSDEEVGMQGAKLIDAKSAYFQEMVEGGTVGIVGEPTRLSVIHAHKGGQRLSIKARGRSAHTSTNDGINANYQLIPALPELLALREESEQNPKYHNSGFEPCTLSWNMTIINEPEAVNVTPSLAMVNLFIRTMPEVDHRPLLESIREICQRHGLELDFRDEVQPWQVDSDSAWIRDMLSIVGQNRPQSVCFATDAGVLQRMPKILISGPGDIQQAHRSDEWISLEQLQRGVEVYGRAFRHWAGSNSQS